MSLRAIDGVTGDWTFGQGRQNYLTGAAEINQDIATALKVFLGECFFDTSFGVDWFNLLGGRSAQAIVLQCRTVIAKRRGVTKINKVDAFLDARTRRLSITYNVSTVYSLQTINTVAVAAA